jgi:hypothetical protein
MEKFTVTALISLLRKTMLSLLIDYYKISILNKKIIILNDTIKLFSLFYWSLNFYLNELKIF